MNKQLEQWLAGNPIHDAECVPDFSCCRGKENIAPLSERERFCKAVSDGDDQTRFEMLGMFLGRAFASAYIAGLNIQGLNQ
jgi:hypothetical protein